MFPPEQPGLALIGLAQPIGALLPISELQSRWAARVFAGKATLPPPEVMWDQVRTYQAQCRARYYQGPRHTLQVDWIDYLDEVSGRGARLSPLRDTRMRASRSRVPRSTSTFSFFL